MLSLNGVIRTQKGRERVLYEEVAFVDEPQCKDVNDGASVA